MNVANDTENARTLLVLYASQTGTACEVAERIGRDARRRYFSVKVMPMDDYDIVSDPIDCLCHSSVFNFVLTPPPKCRKS